MPRDELELVDAATEYIAAQHEAMASDSWEGDEGDDSWNTWEFDGDSEDAANVAQPSWSVESTPGVHLENVIVEAASGGKATLGIAAASIKTAASLEPGIIAAELPRVSPDVFKQGMAVLHPEYGPGKIVALSGAGKNRRATIQFATVGEKKIILIHSAVRPAR
jgi:DNA helicase II / ATP-dependent DNA helicase PcrA